MLRGRSLCLGHQQECLEGGCQPGVTAMGKMGSCWSSGCSEHGELPQGMRSNHFGGNEATENFPQFSGTRSGHQCGIIHYIVHHNFHIQATCHMQVSNCNKYHIFYSCSLFLEFVLISVRKTDKALLITVR